MSEKTNGSISIKTIVSGVAVTVIAGAIFSVYGKLDTLSEDMHIMQLEITREVGNVRAEIGQYHAMLGAQQREIERMDEELHRRR